MAGGGRRAGEGSEAAEDAPAALGQRAWGPGLAAAQPGLGFAHLAQGPLSGEAHGDSTLPLLKG